MPIFRNKQADRLCDHLRLLGIEAEILHGHPLQKVCTEKGKHFFSEPGMSKYEWKSVGLIQVAGKNIGYINIIQYEDSAIDFTPSYRSRLKYLVPLREIPWSLSWAALRTKKRGLFRREVVDVEWKGGTLTDRLNNDSTLKQSLLMEFQQTGSFDITVAPEPIYRCIKIETGLTGRHLPSGNLFDCLDRIAELATEHVTEVNSRPEQVLFEAKVEVNPWAKNAEYADCCITDRQVLLKSKEPLQIHLHEVEVSYASATPGSMSDDRLGSIVRLTYRDTSGHSRLLKFLMPTHDAESLANTIRNAYPCGITQWVVSRTSIL